MLYAFKYFLILSVVVFSIDYLSQHVGPSTPAANGKPLRSSSTSRNYRYRSHLQLLVPEMIRKNSHPGLTSLHSPRKDKGGFSMTSQSPLQFLSWKFGTPWLKVAFGKESVNDKTQGTVVNRKGVSGNGGKSNIQAFKEDSLQFHKNGNHQTNMARSRWRRSMKSSFEHTNQHIENQTRLYHPLVKRSYVSLRSRNFNNEPQNFGVNTDISGEGLAPTSLSSGNGVNKSLKSSVDSKAHEHNSSCSFTKTRINCFSRDLTDVPTYPFPATVTKYKLSRNLIMNISDFAFERYSALKVLDLSQNLLQSLCYNSFAGIQNLRHLNLSKNKLCMTDFPANVFSPLESLKILCIHANSPSNCKNLTYPDLALSKLSKLKELYMDGLQDKDLGPGFKNLTHLDTLSLSGRKFRGNCKLRSLKNTTFVNVPNISYLSLRSCGIHGNLIEADTFSPLTRLATLNLNDNSYIGFEHLRHIFYGLREKKTLKYLFIGHIVSRSSIGICLDSEYISKFPQYVEKLVVAYNALEGIDRNVIAKLSPSLKELDVTANAFAFGTYLQDLPKMRNLTKLRYNGYYNELVFGLPHKFPSHKKVLKMTTSNCSLHQTESSDTLENGQLLFRLPPQLKFVEMNTARLVNRLTEFNIDPDNELESLSMFGNYFPRLIGPITGLRKLKTLYLNSSNIRYISADFFQNLKSLEYLDLSSNQLTSLYDKAKKHPIFTTLQRLKFLNLSCNEMTRLHDLAFQGLVNLTELYLRHNRLGTFLVNMSPLQKLEMLDLSDNLITRLPRRVTEYIESVSDNRTFTLNLADCPIQCTCANFQFLKWFSQSKFKIDQRYLGNYGCTDSDNSFMYVSDRYQLTVAVLSRECVTNYILFLVTGVFTLFLFCIIFGAIIYRFRWNLRYFYYAAYLRYKKTPTSSDVDYEFDVFISYAEEDTSFVIERMSPELESRGVNMLIHGRDFKAGEYIASNVVNAVGSSKKTLVVLTRNMMNSYWCGYELQMANMESVQRGRKVLIFLLMEKIPESELGVELLYNIRNNTYIPYPDTLTDDTSMGRLWDKLVADIKH